MLRVRGLLFLNLIFACLSLLSLLGFVSTFRLWFCSVPVRVSSFILFYRFLIVAAFHVFVYGLISLLNAFVAVDICMGVDKFAKFVAVVVSVALGHSFFGLFCFDAIFVPGIFFILVSFLNFSFPGASAVLRCSGLEVL